MYRRCNIGALGLAMTGLLMAGCTNPGASTTSSGSSTTTAASPAASESPAATKATLKLTEPEIPAVAVPSAPAKRAYKIGVSLLTRDDEFYKTLEQGLKEAAEKQKVEITILSGDKDLNKQINQVQTFIAQKQDAIVLCPVDSQGIIAAVTAANKANIPVFTADIASKGGKVTSYIASDNVQGGRILGEYAAKEVLKEKGEVAILNQSTVSSVQDRVKGFKEALSKYPNIKVVAEQDVDGGKRENAVPKAINIMTAQPKVNLIFGINDPTALGALSALQQLKKTDVAVVGFDAVPEAQSYISSNSQLKADAIQYPRLIGASTVSAVVKSLNGEAVPPVVQIPTGLVNAQSFTK
jgi:ribose transport system substrate-binding protein